MDTDVEDLTVTCSEEDDNPEEHIGELVDYDLAAVEEEE